MDLIEIYHKTNHFGNENGMKLTIIEPGHIEYRMTILKSHLATKKAAHGGILAAFMDAILGVAALSKVKDEGKLVATVEFKINYIRPSFLNDELLGIGKVISQGKRILVSDGKIYNQKKELICTAIGTFNAYPIDKSDISEFLKKHSF
jgi:uncharacterized protein (TIGR00369 family)